MSSQEPEIIIVTGEIDSGKSRMLEKLALDEKRNGVSGIIARGVVENGAKIGFDMIDLSSGIKIPLARTAWEPETGFKVGKYIFSREGFNLACEALLNFRQDGVVFLDEAGPLELNGEGYADCLKTLLGSNISRLYVAVRGECLNEFTQKFVKSNPTKIIRTDSGR